MKKALYVDLSLIENKDKIINNIITLAKYRNVLIETININTTIIVLVDMGFSNLKLIGATNINDNRLKMLSIGYKLCRTRTSKIIKHLTV